jgi:hypothetical protein
LALVGNHGGLLNAGWSLPFRCLGIVNAPTF